MIIDRYKKIQTGVVVGLLFAFLMILSPILCMASDETKDRREIHPPSIASALIMKNKQSGRDWLLLKVKSKNTLTNSFEILGEFSTDEFIGCNSRDRL